MDDNFILELSTPVEEQVTNFQLVCSRIFSRNEFVDCTLCCADGQLQAHRVILACASNYMHNILSSTPWPTPCSHPLLFFKSFTLCDMKLAVEFIYTGKTQISKHKLPILMNIAREMGCTNLSKAIEKAIHSYGIEIFRKRIQTVEANNVGTITTKRPTSAFTQNKTINDKVLRQQINEIIPPDNSETERTLLVQPIDAGQEEESIFSNDIKIEPAENMTLELDPSSLVTTTLGDKNTNQTDIIQSTYTCPADANIENSLQVVNIRGSELVSPKQEHCERNRVIQNDMACIMTIKNKLSDTDNVRNIGQVQNSKLADTNVPGNVIDNVDDDQLQMEEDDDEMPITVVDLKSLAETGLEPEAEIIAMSSTVDNMDTLPANCPWCFQVFTSLPLLQRHIKTHIGNYKPYACQYCPASFARSAHLKRHVRTHTGEKPFVCSYCSRAFSRQDKLKTHLEKHLLDQQLQNSAKLGTLGSFSTTSQSLMRSISVPKHSPPTSPIGGLSPPKQLMQSLPNSSNFSQCIPSPSLQYFLNDPPDPWQSQADHRLPKGLLGMPGQMSTTGLPCTLVPVTSVPSLLLHTNTTSSPQL